MVVCACVWTSEWVWCCMLTNNNIIIITTHVLGNNSINHLRHHHGIACHNSTCYKYEEHNVLKHTSTRINQEK